MEGLPGSTRRPSSGNGYGSYMDVPRGWDVKPGHWLIGGICCHFQETTVDTLPIHIHVREGHKSVCLDSGPMQPMARQSCPCPLLCGRQVCALDPSELKSD